MPRRLVEFGFANQEGVMLRRDFAVGVWRVSVKALTRTERLYHASAKARYSRGGNVYRALTYEQAGAWSRAR
jgi:hypothetical protein